MNTAWNTIYTNKIEKYTHYNILEPHESMEWLSSFFKEQKVTRILDLGCGAGRNALFLAKKGYAVWGVDTAQAGLSVAEAQAKTAKVKLTLSLRDIYEPLPYADGFFDAIISIQVLQHNTREHIQKTLIELHRILKPGGYICITVCGRYSKGKLRYCLVKTADKIAEHTYIPTSGDEAGLVHFIYNKKLLLADLAGLFSVTKFWKDSKDYYCVLAQKK